MALVASGRVAYMAHCGICGTYCLPPSSHTTASALKSVENLVPDEELSCWKRLAILQAGDMAYKAANLARIIFANVLWKHIMSAEAYAA